MQRVYYQSQVARIAAGTILLMFGLSPLILIFYINVVRDSLSVTQVLQAIFNTNDVFAKFACLIILALYAAPATTGFLFIKNSKNVAQLEFREKDIRFVSLPKMKSKGDVWAMGFGYCLDYQTIPYQNIVGIEITGKKNAKRIKIETGETSQVLNITVGASEAEEIKTFIKGKSHEILPPKSKRSRRVA